MPEVVKADGPDVRLGPQRIPVLGTSAEVRVGHLLPAVAPALSADVAVAQDDARPGHRPTEHALQRHVSSHHPGRPRALRELGRELTLPRGTNGGIAFAEHFIALTDLFVGLVRPYFLEGTPLWELPFGWDAADDMRLPWREPTEAGALRERTIRPDAILTVPAARHRIFIECETGTHTLVPVRKDRPQATVNKAARYETFLRGLADVRRRLTHYAAKYPDGWVAEVLFLVPTDRRRDSTEAALSQAAQATGAQRLFRACTPPEAVAHLRKLLPQPSGGRAD